MDHIQHIFKHKTDQIGLTQLRKEIFLQQRNSIKSPESTRSNIDQQNCIKIHYYHHHASHRNNIRSQSPGHEHKGQLRSMSRASKSPPPSQKFLPFIQERDKIGRLILAEPSREIASPRNPKKDTSMKPFEQVKQQISNKKKKENVRRKSGLRLNRLLETSDSNVTPNLSEIPNMVRERFMIKYDKVSEYGEQVQFGETCKSKNSQLQHFMNSPARYNERNAQVFTENNQIMKNGTHVIHPIKQIESLGDGSLRTFLKNKEIAKQYPIKIQKTNKINDICNDIQFNNILNGQEAVLLSLPQQKLTENSQTCLHLNIKQNSKVAKLGDKTSDQEKIQEGLLQQMPKQTLQKISAKHLRGEKIEERTGEQHVQRLDLKQIESKEKIRIKQQKFQRGKLNTQNSSILDKNESFTEVLKKIKVTQYDIDKVIQEDLANLDLSNNNDTNISKFEQENVQDFYNIMQTLRTRARQLKTYVYQISEDPYIL